MIANTHLKIEENAKQLETCSTAHVQTVEITVANLLQKSVIAAS